MQFSRFVCLLALVVVTMLPAAVAQKNNDKAHQQVAAAVEALRVAMLSADKSALEALASQALSYGHSSGVVEDKATFVETIVSGKSKFKTIDLSNQTITINGPVALVRHNFKAQTEDGGRPGNANINILLVWQKENKAWKLVARQAVRAAN